MISKWAESQHLKCHPIKLLGPKTWLISTEHALPSHVLTFNGAPLIVKKLEGRHVTPRQGVVAGPQPKVHQSAKSPQPSQHSEPLRGDPWAKYRQEQGLPSSANTASATASASVPGPTAQRLEHQDTKITNLQQAFDKLQVDLRTQVSHQDEKLHSIERQVAEGQNATASALQAFKVDFEGTLHRAMSIQDQRIASSIQELKGFLQRPPTRGSKRGPTHSEEMEGSEDEP